LAEFSPVGKPEPFAVLVNPKPKLRVFVWSRFQDGQAVFFGNCAGQKSGTRNGRRIDI